MTLPTPPGASLSGDRRSQEKRLANPPSFPVVLLGGFTEGGEFARKQGADLAFFRVLMPGLDAANERAVKGELALKHGRHHCPWQAEILAYVSGRGVGVTELPWAVDKDDEAAWESEWLALLASAKADSDALNRKQLILWLLTTRAFTARAFTAR